MTTLVCYVVRCDRCGVDFETDYDKATRARAEARLNGWTRPRHSLRNQMRIDACPACSEGEGA